MRRVILIVIVIVSLMSLALPVALVSALKSDFAGKVFIASAMGGHLTILRLLLAAGIDPNLRVRCQGLFLGGEWDGSALLAAAWEGQPDVVEELLRYGADLNLRGNGCVAVRVGENFAFACLPDKPGLQGSCTIDYVTAAEADAFDSVGVTPLMAAAFNGHKDIVEVLLAHGAPVDARMNQGATALMLAAMRGDIPVVRALLSAGADVNARSTANFTPLILAAWNQGIEQDKEVASRDQVELVQILLDSGAQYIRPDR